MKKIISLLLMSLFVLFGCDSGNKQNIGDRNEGSTNGYGKVTFALEPGAPILITPQASMPDTRADQVDLSAFGLEFRDHTSQVIQSYESYSQVPAELSFQAGLYTISAANNGIARGAAFDKPLYAGLSAFNVIVGQTTAVKLVCELKSTGIRVRYSDKMLSLLTDIEVTVSSTDGGILSYNVGEKRVGWYSVPADAKINVHVRARKMGVGTDPASYEWITNTQTISAIKARELRNVNLDVKTSGSATVQITIDPTIISKDITVSVPDSDDIIDNNGDDGSWEEGGDPDPKPDPDPSESKPMIDGASHEGSPFDLNQVIVVDRSNATHVNILDVKIGSKAVGGLTNLFLTIESELLAPMLDGVLGITGEIDLANPPSGVGAPAWVEMFASGDIALIDPAVPIKGKTEHMFSVGKLMALLGVVDTAGGVEHKFHLRVVDANGETLKTLTVKLQY